MSMHPFIIGATILFGAGVTVSLYVICSRSDPERPRESVHHVPATPYVAGEMFVYGGVPPTTDADGDASDGGATGEDGATADDGGESPDPERDGDTDRNDGDTTAM